MMKFHEHWSRAHMSSEANGGRVSVGQRIEDLVHDMTLDEKLAQLGGVWSTDLIATHDTDPAGSGFSAVKAATAMPHGAGQITRIAATTGLRPDGLAMLANDIQRWLVDRDPARHPGDHPRRGRRRLLRPRRRAVPAGDRAGVDVRSRPAPRRRRASVRARCWPSAPARRCHRCSTSPAIHDGEGSRRPTARTRSWPGSWARPTSRVSRTSPRPTTGPWPDCARASSPPASTSSATALSDGGLNHGPVQHRLRASCATCSPSRSPRRSATPAWRRS